MTIQPPHPIRSPLETAILVALKQGGLNRGELSDLTAQPYARLIPVLDSLLSKNLIESYFQTYENNLPILTYRLRSLNSPKHKTLPPPPPPPLRPLFKESRS